MNILLCFVLSFNTHWIILNFVFISVKMKHQGRQLMSIYKKTTDSRQMLISNVVLLTENKKHISHNTFKITFNITIYNKLY